MHNLTLGTKTYILFLEQSEQQFSIVIRNELKFDERKGNVCLKAQRKLTVLTRMRKQLAFKKLKNFV